MKIPAAEALDGLRKPIDGPAIGVRPEEALVEVVMGHGEDGIMAAGERGEGLGAFFFDLLGGKGRMTKNVAQDLQDLYPLAGRRDKVQLAVILRALRAERGAH